MRRHERPADGLPRLSEPPGRRPPGLTVPAQVIKVVPAQDDLVTALFDRLLSDPANLGIPRDRPFGSDLE